MNNPFDFDSELKEECGVFGISEFEETKNENAVSLTIRGLFALQHRGQEAAGIVAFGPKGSSDFRGLGLVSDVFRPNEVAEKLNGTSAVGHVRYSTSGDNTNDDRAFRNIQPLFVDMALGGVAVAHNGNLTNTTKLRDDLIKKGCIFQSTIDTETILHLLATSSKETLMEKIKDSLSQVKGAYSLILLTSNSMIGIRDRFGLRPLMLGKLKNSHVLSSETCALDSIGAEFIREINPGEIINISKEGVTSDQLQGEISHRHCSFEAVYFARPDSLTNGTDFGEIRERMGMQLSREFPHDKIKADFVTPVPDSGIPAAHGFHLESGIPYTHVLVRSHYVGRTFIQPSQASRKTRVALKFNPRKIFKGKSIVLVDDSLVRGTTSKKIIEMLRKAGIREIHLCISSPPVKHPCFYGIDTPEEEELLAHRMDIEGMRKYLGVDSLTFLSVDGMKNCIGGKGHCTACFTGNYPEAIS